MHWWQALGADPLRRLGFTGQAEGRLRELTRASLSTPSPAQRERVDLAVREVADEVAAVLPSRWVESVRTATAPHVDELSGALDEAVAGVDLTVRRAWWWDGLRVAQYALAVAAGIGFVWLALIGVLRWAGRARPSTPYVGPVPLPTLLFVGGLVLGAALGLLGAWLVRRGARRRRGRAVEELRSAVAQVAWDRVIAPVAAVLEDHRTARESLSAAF